MFACIFISLPLVCNTSCYVYKYIEPYLQWDPYPFLFGSPARYDTSIYAYSLIDLLWIPCHLLVSPTVALTQIELGTVKLFYVPTNENTANLFTKNLGPTLFLQH
jgi:hypothetical protein